jgi:hypothetical protein
MRKFLFAVTLLAVLGASAFAQDAKAKADQVLKQARAAIGDESKWKNLQSLTASGTARQTMGDRQMESEIQIDLLLPDKIMRTSNSQFGSTINTLNGAQLWTDFVPAVGMGGGGFGGGGQRMIMGGLGGPGGSGGADNPMVKYFQQGQRRDLVLITLGWLLTAPAGVEFAYLAEAPGPNGSKLDALSAKDANGLNAVLYFDQQSHQLIGIKYKSKQLGRGGFAGRGPGGPGGQRQGGGQPGQGGQGGGQPGQNGQGGQRQAGAQGGQPGQRPEMTPEERERRMKEAMENFDKAPEVDNSWAFSEYKNVGGLNLPHRMTRSQGGTPTEEWEISKIKINPKLSADKFVKKEKAPPTQ